MILLGGVTAVLVIVLALVALRLRTTRAHEAAAAARLAAVLESLAAGLAVWSPAGRLIACNGRFREFYPSVTLKPGLEFEDLIRFTVTRAVVLVPEDEIEDWIDARISHVSDATVETLRTPDERWIEMRTIPTDRGEMLLLYTDVTANRAATAAIVADRGRTASRSADLALLTRAASVGANAPSFHAAARDILELVAVWGGWQAATVYLVSADKPGPLASTGIWHVAENETTLVEIRPAVDACADDPDDQLLRRTAQSGEVAWVGNIEVDPRVSDARRRALTGVRAVCAVPVASGSRVVAVLEFFSRAQRPPDESAAPLLASVSGQLARVFERERVVHVAGTARDGGV